MYYPKLTYASSTIEGVFLFGILFLLNKIYGLESLYYIGNFQIIHMEEPNKSHWETPLLCPFLSSCFHAVKGKWLERTFLNDLSASHAYIIFFVNLHMPKNLSAQFVCPIPNVWDFDEKRLHWASVVHVFTGCVNVLLNYRCKVSKIVNM